MTPVLTRRAAARTQPVVESGPRQTEHRQQPGGEPGGDPHARANRTTAISTPTSSMRGTTVTASVRTTCATPTVTVRPAALPTRPRSTHSASSCRTSRPRPAPSEARTAISRVRSVPRASRKVGDIGHRDEEHERTGRNISRSVPVCRRQRGHPSADAARTARCRRRHTDRGGRVSSHW